jgi:hypothetical protein
MRLISLLSFLLLTSICYGQRLDRFAGPSDLGRNYGYPQIKNYYGYIDSTQTPDEVRDGKEYYFLYFTLTAEIPDIGIRIVNPVPTLAMPDKGDVVSENYYEHEKEKSGRWNTWMALEYEPADMTGWLLLEFNDDGKESPYANNSVIRIKDKKNIRLLPGNYRIVISSSEKKEKIVGGFLVQVGSWGNIKTLELSNGK